MQLHHVQDVGGDEVRVLEEDSVFVLHDVHHRDQTLLQRRA